MTALGNHHHDFPHLAKQSGFCFQFHKGKVNWAEIENLNITDIVENKNFQLLEDNLTNVINCNLEEYDLKVIDQNFVKLFKLAQLGVDYLSYCEAYLDKCVVILQEQLNTFQEECESLKHEKEKRKEESKRKHKNHSYQCGKCDKVFISDFYLKFHDKRRHNISGTPKRFDESPRRCTDRWQQTEGERKSTTSTQTTLLNTDRATAAQDDGDAMKIMAQDTVKIDNLEQEIQHLKERLKKAENALTEKKENCTAGSFPSLIPGPPCHNTMLLLLPSCQAQSGSSHDEVKPRLLVSAPQIRQQNISQVHVTADPKAVGNKSPSGTPYGFNTKSEKIISEKENGSTKAEVKFKGEKEDVETTEERKRETGESSECEKENIDPIKEKALTKSSKPLPPPRKSKKAVPTRSAAVELTAPPKQDTQPGTETEGFCSQQAMVTSTPVKRESSSSIFERPRESLGDLNQKESISSESFNSKRSSLVEDTSASFFKTMVKKNSPKFRTLGQNLRRSLTNLCDSVSFTGKKDFMKKESRDQNVKTPAIDRMNNHLRQMGVDPEWSGIPKKTMKQKLKALEHGRKFLIKENPMYPIIRQNIEEAILRKLRKNLGGKDGKNLKRTKKLDQQAPMKDNQPIIQSEDIKSQSCVMYDIESHSESQTSDSEINSDRDVAEQNITPETADAEKEFDLTIFQVGGGSLNRLGQKDVSTKLEDLLTDSGTDGDFSEEKNFKAVNKLLSDKKNGEMAEQNEGQNKSGNRNTLKGTHGFHSTLQLNAKKKVWFLSNSDDSEEELSDSPTGDDDLWSLKGDWERNAG